MALARVERVEIIATDSIKDELLVELQEVGVLQLEEISPELNLNPVRRPPRSYEPLLFRLRQTINYLSSWRKTGLSEKWLKPRPVINRQEREAILSLDWENLLKPIEQAEANYREISNEIKALEKERELLLPWQSLELPLAFLNSTETMEILLARLPRSHLNELMDLEKEEPLWIYQIRLDKRNAYLLLLIWRPALKEIEEKLKPLNLSFFFLPEPILKRARPQDTLKDIIFRLESLIREKEEAQAYLEKKSQEFSSLLPQLSIALDVFENEQHRLNAHNYFGQTERTIFLQGWIESANLTRLKQKLAPFMENLALFHRPPLEGEEPPVVLRNPAVIEPFQLITSLYGLPRPGTIDPTLALAPFFFIYVGLCVSEAGYGLLVTLLSLFFISRIKPRGSALLFSRLLLALGLSTIILGTLVGGWFGFPIRQLLLLDPLTQPVSFLLLALALGFVQVWFGTLLKVIDSLRRERNLTRFLAQTGWLILLPSIVLYGLKKIDIFGFSSLLGAFLIVLFSSPRKNPLVRFLGGLYSLYDISKYLGDVLSYSRLLALGLSTSVIAMVVNTLSGTALKIPVLGWIAAPVVFLGGHLFNLAISFLGGFVHSMRLQFVEFFTKFYEAGGKPLKPFSFQGRYVDFE